jgi:ubiquinone/menaquinone biosynthesis C-methylase UbiE
MTETSYPTSYFMRFPGIFYAAKGLVSDIRKNTPKGKLRVLDYGCGICQNLFEIATKIDIEGTGIDIEDEYLAINEKVRKFNRMNNIMFEKTGIDKRTRFSDNYFDVVISGHVLEHTRKPQAMIREIRRILSPNGILILSTPYKYNRKIWSFANLFGFNKGSPDHVVEGYTRREMEKLLDGDFEIRRFGYTERFLIRFLADISTLATVLLKRRHNMSGEEASLYKKMMKGKALKFEKTPLYKLFHAMGIVFIIPYEIDNILSKIIPFKGYGISLVAKVKK